LAGRLLYLDTSALAKVVVKEEESEAVYRFLRDWPLRISSIVTWVELPRAVRRKPDGAKAARRAQAVLERIDLIDLDVALARTAAALNPASLRALDAIHLAAAISVGDCLGGFLAYDARLTRAAKRARLPTLTPA
jgi:uncharacterized protein